MPQSLTPEQRNLIKEYAKWETNTPGTIDGLNEESDKSYSKETSNQNTEEPEKKEGFFTKLKKKILG